MNIVYIYSLRNNERISYFNESKGGKYRNRIVILFGLGDIFLNNIYRNIGFLFVWECIYIVFLNNGIVFFCFNR